MASGDFWNPSNYATMTYIILSEIWLCSKYVSRQLQSAARFIPVALHTLDNHWLVTDLSHTWLLILFSEISLKPWPGMSYSCMNSLISTCLRIANIIVLIPFFGVFSIRSFRVPHIEHYAVYRDFSLGLSLLSNVPMKFERFVSVLMNVSSFVPFYKYCK